MQPPPLEPDTKDWTSTITEGCAQCGFDPSYDVTSTGERLRAAVPGYVAALSRPDAAERPAPTVWSPLEYGCHVRDVFRLFGERLALMLEQDDPLFANWDQDETAVAERYWEQDPVEVASALAEGAAATSAAFDAVRDDQWERTGRRSNGSVFTVRTLAVYFLHDVEHHLVDLGG
jgi:DinB superfamily